MYFLQVVTIFIRISFDSKPTPFNYNPIMNYKALHCLTIALLLLPTLNQAQNQYCEQNGLVVVEVESEATVSNWSAHTTVPTPNSQLSPPSFTGTGFYMWKENCGVPASNWSGCGGADGGNAANAITYRIQINNPGRYRFQLRSWQPNIAYDPAHAANTENNDVFVRFQDGAPIRKKGAAGAETALGNTAFTKVYQNVLNNWTWNTSTVDNNPHEFYLDVATPGIYRIQLAGRSKLFAIDRFTLWHTTLSNGGIATNTSTPASPLSCSATYYQDLDGDGYGNPNVTSGTLIAGYVTVAGDCNDNNAAINPSAIEICGNAVDENCDGIVLAGQTWYQDLDADGYGSTLVTQITCNQPSGYVASSGDCDDTNPLVAPFLPETQGDGIDNNCNGIADENNTLSAIFLINADTDLPLFAITPNQTINLLALPTQNLNIEARAAGTVGSTVFVLSGAMTRNQTETAQPFALYGDASGNFNNWTPNLGTYNLNAKAFTGSGGTGTQIIEVNFAFTFSNTGTLPVEWGQVEAQENTAGVKISWSTMREQNNHGFEIERSFDARVFENIGWVEGNGNSTTISQYQFNDKRPHQGINYYRLKQIDIDGAVSYSPIVEVTLTNEKLLEVYPNPVSDGMVTVAIGNWASDRVTLTVVSTLGQVVWENTSILKAAEREVSFSSNNLPSGIYFVNIASGSESHSVILHVR